MIGPVMAAQRTPIDAAPGWGTPSGEGRPQPHHYRNGSDQRRVVVSCRSTPAAKEGSEERAMRHLGRLRTILFYSGAILELGGAIWAFVATHRPIPQRLAPLLLGYALMLLAYLLAKLAVRYWSRPTPAVWDRIAQRLLETPAVDEVAETDADEARTLL